MPHEGVEKGIAQSNSNTRDIISHIDSRLIQLEERASKRLDKIEEKLDTYTEGAAAAKADINWLKGYVKITTTLLITVIGTMVSFILRHLR